MLGCVLNGEPLFSEELYFKTEWIKPCRRHLSPSGFSLCTEAVIKTSQWRNLQWMKFRLRSQRSYRVSRSVGRWLSYELSNSQIFTVVMISVTSLVFLFRSFTCWLNSLCCFLSFPPQMYLLFLQLSLILWCNSLQASSLCSLCFPVLVTYCISPLL